MADLDTTLEMEGARTIGSQVALAHLSGLDRAVSREVAAHDQVQDVTLLGVRAGHPGGPLDDARVDQVAHGTGDVAFLVHDALGRVGAEHRGADVAAHQLRVRLKVGVRRHLNLGGSNGSLETLHINVAVTGHAHDEELALAIRVRQRHDDVLQRVCRAPGTVLARVALVEQVHERLDRRRIGRRHLDRSGNAGRILNVRTGVVTASALAA